MGRIETATRLALWVLGACLTTPAWAALGGSVASVEADSSALRGAVSTTAEVDYDVQQITSGSLVVHEYLTRSGQVFAVTWQGPTPPNLQLLLGDYFARFQSAAVSSQKAEPGIHRAFHVRDSELVVQSVGRLRDFHGIAYLPALVPQGVAVNDLL